MILGSALWFRGPTLPETKINGNRTVEPLEEYDILYQTGGELHFRFQGVVNPIPQPFSSSRAEKRVLPWMTYMGVYWNRETPRRSA